MTMIMWGCENYMVTNFSLILLLWLRDNSFLTSSSLCRSSSSCESLRERQLWAAIYDLKCDQGGNQDIEAFELVIIFHKRWKSTLFLPRLLISRHRLSWASVSFWLQFVWVQDSGRVQINQYYWLLEIEIDIYMQSPAQQIVKLIHRNLYNILNKISDSQTMIVNSFFVFLK